MVTLHILGFYEWVVVFWYIFLGGKYKKNVEMFLILFYTTGKKHENTKRDTNLPN
jgi:hypothetical protein